MSIHSTAIIDPMAEIAANATIGAYAVIDGPVRIGSATRVYAHAHISGWTTIGQNCEIHPFAVVGNTPQDFQFEGEKSYLVIGDQTVIREHTSIHRGSKPESTTCIGKGCLIMAKAHVGHNCVIDDGAILTNGVDCAGHVQVGANAVLSANVGVHQFTRIGRRVMCAGTARVQHDIPPFFVADYQGAVAKVNTVGLQREGFSDKTIDQIRMAYRKLYRSPLPFKQAVEKLQELDNSPEVKEILDFVTAPSKRGIAGPPCSRQFGRSHASENLVD